MNPDQPNVPGGESAVPLHEPELPHPIGAKPYSQWPRLDDDVKRALAEMGYELPTEVQNLSIEPLLDGADLLVQARTGTGKTASFGIPIIQKLNSSTVGIRALVLCPTRELAGQVASEIAAIGKYRGVYSVAIYGGAPFQPQVAALERGAPVVVGTPGRLLDHLSSGRLDLSKVEFMVLDEADEMLSMGFYEDVLTLIERVPRTAQTLLFSATLDQAIENLVARFLKNPQRIFVSSGEKVNVDRIENEIYFTVAGVSKPRQLKWIFDIEKPRSAIVFCNTRQDTQLVASFLSRNGINAEPLSSEINQRQRERVMAQIKAGELNYMVATDLAARGIDIARLSHVINYSLPEDPAVYIHRVGRTGRIGNTGKAISLVGGKDIVTQSQIIKRYNVKFVEKQWPPEILNEKNDMAMALERERQREAGEGPPPPPPAAVDPQRHLPRLDTIRARLPAQAPEGVMELARELLQAPDAPALVSGLLTAYIRPERGTPSHSGRQEGGGRRDHASSRGPGRDGERRGGRRNRGGGRGRDRRGPDGGASGGSGSGAGESGGG
ncbi:MAG: ATP-dependent RNA helicase DeaD [Myxococcota bacterium]|nr:ATP-dependent RNA helicase DeaD [Myxococcota bacterium]